MALGVFTAGSAQAGVVVVVNGQLWDVSTFTGEYKLGTDIYILYFYFHIL